MNKVCRSVIFVLGAVFAPLLLAACGGSAAPPVPSVQDTLQALPGTGREELDEIIRAVLDNDLDSLRSLVQYTQTGCSDQDGLGGPPKCEEGEAEGDVVEVLPFLGPEGHFLKKEHIADWVGIDAAELYAVYLVSESAYSDPSYPRGEYGIAFINGQRNLITILQVLDGRIVRVDSIWGNPPALREEDVDSYLVPALDPQE